MRPPPGYHAPPGKFCRLKKSLYGLRQAPRNWFSKLASALTKYGFLQSRADYSLFSYIRGSVILHVLVYVDDLIISGPDPATIARFKAYLHSCFHMKDLGTLKYFLASRSPAVLLVCFLVNVNMPLTFSLNLGFLLPSLPIFLWFRIMISVRLLVLCMLTLLAIGAFLAASFISQSLALNCVMPCTFYLSSCRLLNLLIGKPACVFYVISNAPLARAWSFLATVLFSSRPFATRIGLHVLSRGGP